jgi:hypothetical protein
MLRSCYVFNYHSVFFIIYEGFIAIITIAG